jgi:hypothetical protein
MMCPILELRRPPIYNDQQGSGAPEQTSSREGEAHIFTNVCRHDQTKLADGRAYMSSTPPLTMMRFISHHNLLNGTDEIKIAPASLPLSDKGLQLNFTEEAPTGQSLPQHSQTHLRQTSF